MRQPCELEESRLVSEALLRPLFPNFSHVTLRLELIPVTFASP
jgi:hypothetical protein